MVKIKSIRRKHYRGTVHDLTIKNKESPYFYANGVLSHNSAYPHAFMMYNLYTPVEQCKHKINGKCPNPQKGRGIFKDLKGVYCGCEQGLFESVLEKLYRKRKEYKKNGDSRQYAIKIVINLIYGLSGSPVFKHVYNPTTASDCTYMVRTIIKYCWQRLKEEGYETLYTDTDSVYIIDRFKDKNRLLKKMDQIVEEIQADVPFPKDTFGLGFDDEFKAIFFFREEDNPRKFKKKNYIYITQDDKFKIKGLPIIKRNATPISKKILQEKLVPQIIKKQDIKFSPNKIESYIKEYINKDITLIAKNFVVRDYSQYDNSTSIQAQIAYKYGAGKHQLIKNKAGIGIGTGTSYCSIEEAKKLHFEKLDLETVWKELDPFVNRKRQGALI